MSQASQFAAAHHGNFPKRQGTWKENRGSGERGWNPDDAVELALADGVVYTTPASATRNRSANLEGMIPFTKGGQRVQELSELVGGPLHRERRREISSFHPLQEWEGHVIEISEARFTARLHDLTAGTHIDDEEADIPMSELSQADAAKMKVGSIFRWVIGYEIAADKPKKRVSQIVFRDLPAVTQSDQRAGEAWALRVLAALDR